MDRDCELDLIIYVLSLFDGVYFAVDAKWISSLYCGNIWTSYYQGSLRFLRLFQVYTFILVPQHFTSHI